MKKIKRILNNIWADIKQMYIAVGILLVYIVAANLIFGTMCPMTIITGLPCPGCGITRACVLILQLKFFDAACMNVFAYPCILVILYYLVRRYVFEKKEMPTVLIILVGIPMIVYYIWRMFTIYPSQAPMVYSTRNVFEFVRNLAKYIF